MNQYKKILSIILLWVIANPANIFAQNKNLKTDTIKVQGLCEMCKERIENSLYDFGIKQAQWNISSKLLTIKYDSTKISKASVEKKLSSLGHDTENEKAASEVYDALPECCKYDRENKMLTTTDTLATIKGIVVQHDDAGNELPMINATVKLTGASTTVLTDSMGIFSLPASFPAHLTISYAGHQSKNILIKTDDAVKILLKESAAGKLSEVIVSATKKEKYFLGNTLNTINLGKAELSKAACCNLSESFETSPSVDVSYSDGITGIKQIELLGLSGKYIQNLTENMPEIRGLSGNFGLTFIPGPWIESIQLTKGAGSVLNGYESIAGQINIEEIKPETAQKFYANIYLNQMGRVEGTINLAKKVNEKISTALLLHSNGLILKNDYNNDAYLDMPKGGQINIINRWRYYGNKGLFAQWAVKAVKDNRRAGSVLFNPSVDKLSDRHYGVGIDMHQYEATGKVGYVFPSKKYKSIGLMLSAIDFNNESYYGQTAYTGTQKIFYSNLVFQQGSTEDETVFKTGLSFINDRYDEKYKTILFGRTENVAGAFAEYTYNKNKLTFIGGLRVDNHNLYKWITTARANLKYKVSNNTTLRLSAGNGFKVANIFAENPALFISNRQYEIQASTTSKAYGLNPDKAWNYGINLQQTFTLGNRKGMLNFDIYRTDFTQQVVADLDASPEKILFYHLSGKSFSNTIIAELQYELIKKLDIRLAYRLLDVKTQYKAGLLAKPLTARHKAFLNIAYETKNHWKFDITPQWIGKKRLPNTQTNPHDLQMQDYSPGYFQLNAQVTKVFNKNLELYLGGENITGFTQEHLFIDAANPFSRYFDASMVWGPVNAQIVYLGIRFGIE